MYTYTNFHNGTVSQSTTKSLYGYQPYFPLAVVAASLFTLLGVFHVIQYFRLRSWFFYLLQAGIIMEVLGSWARVYSIKHLSDINGFAINYSLLLIAPSLLAAACHQAFGRSIYWVTPETYRGFRTLWLPARYLPSFFVSFAILSFCIQCFGVGVILSTVATKIVKDDQLQVTLQSGMKILRVGLILQMVISGIFVLVATRFIVISRQWKQHWPDGGSNTWKTLAWVLNLSSFLIMLRALHRILELTLNNGQNYMTKHEWPAYAFDTLPIFVLLVFLAVIHPGRYMPRAYTGFSNAFKKSQPIPQKPPSIQVEEASYPSYPHAYRYATSPLRPASGYRS